MEWYESVFELIDLRSFSNLWFWIALAVVWSTASQWILGVPWDMVLRAKKGVSDSSVTDLDDMLRVNINRILYIAEEAGYFMVGFSAFVLTAIFMIGFVYENEFAQALFLIGFPMSIVWLLTFFTARAIRAKKLSGEALYKRLGIHRIAVQVIGLIAIFLTGMWGMYQNVTAGVLG